MAAFRSLLKSLLPRDLKKSLEKLVLGYHSHAPSFSSAGEDMILRHIVGSDKRDGFYVDIGAYHPTFFSNTYFFYLNGWTGINVEARPGSRALFEKIRPRDINLEVGISTEAGTLTYYVVDDDSTMNSFSREFLERIAMLSEVKREVPVPVITLSEMLAQHLPNGQLIDFMNVDVEGHDLNVLQSNDWKRYRPRLIVVEDSRIRPEDSEIVQFMNSVGYAVCAQNVIILDKINEYFFIDRS